MKLFRLFSLVTMMILPFGSWAGDPESLESDPCVANETEGAKVVSPMTAPEVKGGTKASDEDTTESDDSVDSP